MGNSLCSQPALLMSAFGILIQRMDDGNGRVRMRVRQMKATDKREANDAPLVRSY